MECVGSSLGTVTFPLKTRESCANAKKFAPAGKGGGATLSRGQLSVRLLEGVERGGDDEGTFTDDDETIFEKNDDDATTDDDDDFGRERSRAFVE